MTRAGKGSDDAFETKKKVARRGEKDIPVTDLVRSFLMRQEDRNHSPKTVRWYGGRLGRFADWLGPLRRASRGSSTMRSSSGTPSCWYPYPAGPSVEKIVPKFIFFTGAGVISVHASPSQRKMRSVC